MSKLNYEITMYHSPYHDTLVEELSNIIKQKKSIYRRIQSEKDFNEKLSYEEREIMKHLIAKEDKILIELIEHKGWLNKFESFEKLLKDRCSILNNYDDEYEHRAHQFGY